MPSAPGARLDAIPWEYGSRPSDRLRLEREVDPNAETLDLTAPRRDAAFIVGFHTRVAVDPTRLTDATTAFLDLVARAGAMQST